MARAGPARGADGHSSSPLRGARHTSGPARGADGHTSGPLRGPVRPHGAPAAGAPSRPQLPSAFSIAARSPASSGVTFEG